MSDPLSGYSFVNACLSKADILALDEPVTGRMSANVSRCDQAHVKDREVTLTSENWSPCVIFNYKKWIR